MKEIIRYLLRISSDFIVLLFPLLLIGSVDVVIALSLIALSKQVIDIATGTIPGDLVQTILLLVVLMLLSITARLCVSWLSVRLKVLIESKLRARFFSRSLRAEWQTIQQYHSGDIMARVNTDIADIGQLYTTTIPSLVLTTLKLIGAFCYLFAMNRELALLLAGLVPVVLLCSKVYFKKMRKLSREIKETSSLVRQYFQESIQHSVIIKALRLEPLFEKRLDGRQEVYVEKVKEQNRFSIFSNLVLSLGLGAGYLITFTWGLFELQAGLISFGTLTAFLQLVNMIQGPAMGLVGLAPNFVSVYTASERLMEVENIPLEKNHKQQQLIDVDHVTLKRVSFGYTSEKPVLKDINVRFERGAMTALIGKTGCGKTTLIRLLLALIHPDSGEITLSDKKGSYPVSTQTRINFSYVPQENHLFSGTIRDNLRVGNPKATDEELKRVLQQLSAHFVFDTPQGLNTILKEQGEGLSGGQIQRLAIARALLAPGQILLLDEVTSSLDEDTEAEIMHSIKQYARDKIVILVTHRQKVIDACDTSFAVN